MSILDLNQFEISRKLSGTVPPEGSNSFHYLGENNEGCINLLTIRSDKGNERFSIAIESGKVLLGQQFEVSGNIYDGSHPYNNLILKTDTELVINGQLDISRGIVESHGKMIVEQGHGITINDGGSIIFYPDSVLTIKDGSSIDIKDGHITVYGELNVDLGVVFSIIYNKNISIDTAAVINVTNINLPDRPATLISYEQYLRELSMSEYSVHAMMNSVGKITAAWIGGDPKCNAKVLKLTADSGNIILGDFKMSVLGTPERVISDYQFISSIYIKEQAYFYVTENYDGNPYIHPHLLIGTVIGNSKHSGNIDVYGIMMVDGSNAKVTLDRGGTMHIRKGGIVCIRNGAKLISTYNEDDPVLYISGTLCIDNIECLEGFNRSNIVIDSENATIEILNIYDDDNHELFSTPNGVKNTKFYELFGDNIDCLRYHIRPNTGISIDTYYEYYPRDLREWFGPYRIEDAVHRGIVRWYDGAFIRLTHDIIEWVNDACDLIIASQLFKSFGYTGTDKLADVVNRLQYAGFGSVRFILEYGGTKREMIMELTHPEMQDVVARPLRYTYDLTTDKDGTAFIRKMSPSTAVSDIVSNKAVRFEIVNGKTTITL